jgi:alkanesulfonate monooxygenase SsuD/methylene tetrahydromethanopterin reductase-like flavin-dependent oxidoreductase (luciferase family)
MTVTDYGHSLLFGTFITPRSNQPQRVVELAQATERAGLDLVTFMDHPYRPELLDTWTLLSFVAARTERVHLSGYVLNLPSRPPAVLARSAAALDLLSGGRVELAIGPGDTFAVPAVAANGGARRFAPEAVQALDEAIDIVRSIWDTSANGQVTVEGDFYQVLGAARGPRPAHDISIWVPAAGPRMRRLVGEKANGWIAGGAWIADVAREVPAGNQAVDAAAVAVGRDPREIRRIWDFEGSFGRPGRGVVGDAAEHWTAQLLPLVVEHGMSTFILISDEASTIRRFGDEVAPAMREAVGRERSSPRR